MRYTAKLATEPLKANPESLDAPMTYVPPVAATVPEATCSPLAYRTT